MYISSPSAPMILIGSNKNPTPKRYVSVNSSVNNEQETNLEENSPLIHSASVLCPINLNLSPGV